MSILVSAEKVVVCTARPYRGKHRHSLRQERPRARGTVCRKKRPPRKVSLMALLAEVKKENRGSLSPTESRELAIRVYEALR